MADGDGKKWLKYGCLGCAGLIVLMLLVVAGLAGLAWMQVRSEEMQEAVLEPALPAPAPPPAIETAPAAGDAVEQPLPTRLPGRVTIDVRGGEFTIVPAPPGGQLRVDANFDPDQFELVESLEDLEADGWAYEVRFRGPGTSLLTVLKRLFGATTPKLRIQVPVDMPIALDVRLEQTGGQVDLGGMWLTEADVSMSKGGMELEFGEPLREPMERFTFQGTMGGMVVTGLAHASPARLDLDFSMGGFVVEMAGDWRQDCEIDIQASMGGGEIIVPRSARIVGLDDLLQSPSEPGEDRRPTLTFTPGSRLDDVEVNLR